VIIPPLSASFALFLLFVLTCRIPVERASTPEHGLEDFGELIAHVVGSATPRQRCLLHKQRNVLNAVPRRVRQEVEAELVGM